ncbi:alpha/beta hydrolase [Micromonospora purpureochromogenes]|uniref:alpha/beta fold hydrolase n=1 Tax=Micromonospora purpureochromogenes TaxID=47872 RepID=UPI003326FB4C
MIKTEPTEATPGPRRRALLGAAAAAVGTAALAPLDALAAHAAHAAGGESQNPTGPGSVSGAPQLPARFRTTFTSRYVYANGLRQHVVIGGDGPPLLLVHGWPQNWYAWRLLMPALARNFTVIAVDQRGIGLTDKPQDGYDAGTLANDLAALMDALGHERFAVVGHDTGYFIGYALAADHRDRVDRVALAEIPGPPGVVSPGPPLFLPEALNNRLWHIPFNRVNDELIVDMVHGNADAFYRYEFTIQAGPMLLPEYAIDYYVSLYNRDRDALRATFGLYRAWDAMIAQNMQRASQKLTMPVLGIGGENSWAEHAGQGMQDIATDVQTVVIPGAGHWVAEQAPEEMLAALTAFLAPYRAAAANR